MPDYNIILNTVIIFVGLIIMIFNIDVMLFCYSHVSLMPVR